MKGSAFVRGVEGRYRNRISLKLTDESALHSGMGTFDVRPSEPQDVANAQKSSLERVIGGRRYALVRMHTLAESDIDRWEREAEAESGEDRPNLNRWYYLYVDAQTAGDTIAIVEGLNALAFVEIAYASPSGAGRSPTSVSRVDSTAVAPWPSSSAILQRDLGWSRSASATEQRSLSRVAVGRPRAPNSSAAPGQRSIPFGFQDDQEYIYSTRGVARDYLQDTHWNWSGYRTQYSDVEEAWNDNPLGLSALITGQQDSDLYDNGIPNPALLDDYLDSKNHGTSVLGIISSGADENHDGDPDDWGTVRSARGGLHG